MTRYKPRIGDLVAVTWADAVTYPRIEADACDVPLPLFETYGKLAYMDREKIVVLHEREVQTGDPEGATRKLCLEPTALPRGMVRGIKVYRSR